MLEKNGRSILGKGILPLVVTILLLIPLAGVAQGKEVKFPTKPITLVVPYSVGGGTDVQARLLASFWEKKARPTCIG